MEDVSETNLYSEEEEEDEMTIFMEICNMANVKGTNDEEGEEVFYDTVTEQFYEPGCAHSDPSSSELENKMRETQNSDAKSIQLDEEGKRAVLSIRKHGGVISNQKFNSLVEMRKQLMKHSEMGNISDLRRGLEDYSGELDRMSRETCRALWRLKDWVRLEDNMANRIRELTDARFTRDTALYNIQDKLARAGAVVYALTRCETATRAELEMEIINQELGDLFKDGVEAEDFMYELVKGYEETQEMKEKSQVILELNEIWREMQTIMYRTFVKNMDKKERKHKQDQNDKKERKDRERKDR